MCKIRTVLLLNLFFFQLYLILYKHNLHGHYTTDIELRVFEQNQLKTYYFMATLNLTFVN